MIQYLEFFGRILAACICGAVIGFERSKRFKEAGIRTHIIVCCAAALIMILSKYGFADLVGTSGDRLYGTNPTDPARLAAQIITGISFLGAGIIFRNGSSIKGLTTAAGIWATAGIGMAIGAGMYVLGIFTTVVVAVVQIVMHHYTIGTDSMTTARLRCTALDPKTFRVALNEYIEEHKMKMQDIKVSFNSDGSADYELTLLINSDVMITDINEFLESVGSVRAVSFEQIN